MLHLPGTLCNIHSCAKQVQNIWTQDHALLLAIQGIELSSSQRPNIFSSPCQNSKGRQPHMKAAGQEINDWSANSSENAVVWKEGSSEQRLRSPKSPAHKPELLDFLESCLQEGIGRDVLVTWKCWECTFTTNIYPVEPLVFYFSFSCVYYGGVEVSVP